MNSGVILLTPPRKASREQRRQQLIESTIATIARKGYSQTTLTDVAHAAGLSHGLVNFHFHTKEHLLTETLLFMAAEYQNNWRSDLAAAPAESPAAQLDALIRADFNPAICSPDRLAAWCAFWGEAQSRPIYQQECGANDLEYTQTLEKICGRLITEGVYKLDPVRVSRIIRVTVEGTWLEILALKTPYSLDEALATVYVCASALFPRHFTAAGLIRN